MEKNPRKASTGMILGKFLPPHRGHQYLIDFAREKVDHLTVMVCSIEREPIPGRLRFEWMRELYPDLNVVHVTDENPQEPGEHPQFWDIWIESIRRFIPEGPDLVFTSEEYGDELAHRLGSRHVLVDIDRSVVPISATKIRENPFDNWQYIPECVRPYFVKRVAIVGPESTGKTTLSANLAERFQTAWVPEFARDYLEEKYPQESLTISVDDIEDIARGQAKSEDQLARKANKVLVCDTDLITTTVWSEHFLGYCPDWVKQAAEARNYDLYLLTDIDVPWVAEPQRVGDHLRADFLRRLRHELDSRKRAYTLISGSYEDRLVKAAQTIDRLFS
jgi:NadR type nicotinamide-nucleotide adenylyltransferase